MADTIRALIAKRGEQMIDDDTIKRLAVQSSSADMELRLNFGEGDAIKRFAHAVYALGRDAGLEEARDAYNASKTTPQKLRINFGTITQSEVQNDRLATNRNRPERQ